MPRTLGYRVTARRGYPNGVGQMFDVHVGSVMDKRSVRGQRGFVKPRWGIRMRGWVYPGCAAGAATLGYGM